MDWGEANRIINLLRQRDSVTIEFCYTPHGDAVFIVLGSTETKEKGRIVGASGERYGMSFEEALISAKFKENLE